MRAPVGSKISICGEKLSLMRVKSSRRMSPGVGGQGVIAELIGRRERCPAVEPPQASGDAPAGLVQKLPGEAVPARGARGGGAENHGVVTGSGGLTGEAEDAGIEARAVGIVEFHLGGEACRGRAAAQGEHIAAGGRDAIRQKRRGGGDDTIHRGALCRGHRAGVDGAQQIQGETGGRRRLAVIGGQHGVGAGRRLDHVHAGEVAGKGLAHRVAQRSRRPRWPVAAYRW